MKKALFCILSLVFTGIASAQKINDPVILEIDGKPIQKSEFLQIYLKNNAHPSYDQASLDNYMDLFTKFKLKVLEAEKMQMDTLPRLKNELDGYINQLSKPYLVDSAEDEFLEKQAYERMKTEVKASHLLIRVDENASPADTLKAYNKIMEIRKEIESGLKFEEAAKKYSEDPSVKENGGDLGYFSAFQMVYPFENAAYSTPVGQVSQPVRTRFGYHLLFVADKRPTKGLIQVAHIMIMHQPGEKKNISAKKTIEEQKIDEIYEKLQNGEQFDDLARRYSQDQTSRNQGGELPPFGVGSRQRMVPEFEQMAFSLAKDGDYTQPFETDYGWHIIKRISLTPLAAFDSIKPQIETLIKRDTRALRSQASFINKLKAEYKFKDKSKKVLPWFYNHIDSTIFTPEWKAPTLEKNTTLFSFNKINFSAQDFLTKLDDLKGNARYKGSLEHFINAAYKSWQDASLLDYEKSQLSNKYPAYKAIVNEYHDGVLLYEIMNNQVWSKAIADTSGLKTFFANNSSKFMWKDRIDAMVYICDNEKIANEVYQMLQSDKVTSKQVLETINKDSQLNLQVKTNKYETEDVDFLKGHSFSQNVNKPYAFDGHYYVVDVQQKIPAEPKELNDARGAATAAYQTYLENEWVKQLQAKYPVIVHKDVLYSLGK
jgi:peptidyl-prolyl cis-trans isomerase SurA